MLLWARMTEVSMSMGWYLIPRSSMASSRAPTTNRASCLSVGGKNEAERTPTAGQQLEEELERAKADLR